MARRDRQTRRIILSFSPFFAAGVVDPGTGLNEAGYI
jgi:hypothetical protein